MPNCRNILDVKLLACFVSVMISGCSVHKPYAQNPFNSSARLTNVANLAERNTSGSTVSRAVGVGQTVTSRPIPDAIPKGADIGIAAGLFLLLGGPGSSNKAINPNYLVVNMPLSFAHDEDDAQIKVSEILEKAIAQTLQPEYRFKIEEYDDHYAFGKVLRPRWFRVDGPLCENWSCQITAPIPTKNALQWDGKVTKFKDVWRYNKLLDQPIALVKITNEFDKSGSLHVVEGVEISAFNYDQFYRRLSNNLPGWMSVWVWPPDQQPYEYVQGNRVDSN